MVRSLDISQLEYSYFYRQSFLLVGRQFNINAYRPITILGLTDLNAYPALRQPASLNNTKTVGILCCKSGTIHGSLSLPKTGFVSGETIRANVLIKNDCKKEVKPPILVLYEYTRLNSMSYNKSIDRMVCKLDLSKPIAPNSEERFENVGFMIPPVCPSMKAQVLDLTYYLSLKFSAAAKLSSGVEVSIPLTIGSIPFKEDTNIQGVGPNPTTNMFNFQPNVFSSEQTMPQEQPKGEMVGSGPINFSPQYPFFKDLSTKDSNQSKRKF